MKKLSFGIDIGGINTVIGLIDQEGNFCGDSSISTNKYPYFEDYVSYVADLAAAMKALLLTLDFDFEIVGIGIGAPNANIHTGAVENPANLWKHKADEKRGEERIFTLATDLVSQYGDVPHIVVTNDANAAAIGEMVFGSAKGMQDFLMVTLGTGLGSGFVANGELIYGADGFAGELGHVTVVPSGRECGCGKRGCLECYVSATGIKRTAFEMMATWRGESSLRGITYDDFDSKMISDAALAGDKLALEIFRYTGEILGAALANVVVLTSPEAIVMFGGLAKAGDLIFKPTEKYLKENLCPALNSQVELIESGNKDKNIAILGAASLIWQKCLAG